MPNKLTDLEIKKALEICTNKKINNKCKKCPANKECDDDVFHALEKLALDLINRQEEEKTELLGKIEELEANRVELLENIEQLESVITQIKTEAYKEFANWMQKEYADFDSLHEIILPENINKAINDFLEQKVGDGDGK